MSNIFFFTGENEYALFEELKRWKREFAAKHGDENLMTLDGKHAKLIDIIDAVASMPFIAEKRLVVCDGMPKCTKEEMQRVLSACHEQTIFVVADPAPDKRLASTKTIEAEAIVKKFPALNSKTILVWIDDEAARQNVRLEPAAKTLLLERVGDDARMIAMELQKYAMATVDGMITVEIVQALTPLSGERVVWGLTNLLGERKVNDALLFLWDHVERGENPYGLWTILLDMARKTLSIWAAKQAGYGSAAIASELKMHPFAVRGLLPLASALSDSEARRLCAFLVDADIALKTGCYRYSIESPEEIIALTERAILACA